MIKTMENLGFEYLPQFPIKNQTRQSAKSLEEESGIRITRTVDSEFQRNFYEGNWTNAVKIVNEMDIYDSSKRDIIFYLYKMKYIESLQNQDFQSALTILREELTRYSDDQQDIDQLSQLMLCVTDSELKNALGFDISLPEDKRKLMIQLQNKFKSKDSFSPNR